MLRDLGAEIVDADTVAHEVMAPGGPVFDQIVREFGPGVVAPDGSLDRRALGAIVFRDPAALRRLDAIVHPSTGVEIRRRIAASSAGVVVVEAIKLIEAGTDRACDSVWVVVCDPAQQIERLIARNGFPRDEAERRVAAQAPIGEKLARADLAIDTRGTIEETRRQVEAAWRRIKGSGGAARKDQE
jgi:dephospho-CoA kinase